MKNALIIYVLILMIAACGQAGGEQSSPASDESAPKADVSTYDPERGTGKFSQVDIPATLDPKMAAAGKKIVDVKCASCHKMTDEKLVGPGWKEVTNRHKPEWIMNFITNVDDMLAKDPKAQAMLELCLVRMPNQNLSDDDARSIFEFMRQNDGVK